MRFARNGSDVIAKAGLGRCYTKIDEAKYVSGLLEADGLPVTLADLSAKGHASILPVRSSPSRILISAAEIAANHPRGEGGVFSGDRGTAVAAMTEAFERFARLQHNVGGLLGVGGSGVRR